MKHFRIISVILIGIIFLTSCTLGQAQFQLPQGAPGERIYIMQSAPPLPQCIDSDDTLTHGDDTYYTSGFVITPYGTDYDFCKGDKLVEQFCEFGHKKHVVITCMFGCFDGSCLSTLPEPSTKPVI